jgi:hypothetical protein
MDGTDASTTFTDSSFTNQKTVTANQNAQIDTAQKKFGTASGLFDGDGDNLTVPDHADWDFGTGDYTVDFQVRWASVGTTTLVERYGSTFDFKIQYASGTVYVYEMSNGSNNFISGTWTPSQDTWYHIAVVRTSGATKLFIGGVEKASDTLGQNISASSNLYIGSNASSAQSLNGWMDEFRIVKGTAVWTTGFTAPSNAYARKTAGRNQIIWVE